MVSTFTNPVVNSVTRLNGQFFDTAEPVELWPNDSQEKIEVVIRAVYRQVLGNAHVMESERLIVPESQLKRGEISVREFVRRVAKSELYRTLFADSCYRYRSMELNFKHLLGRAPQSFAELKTHSAILDEIGYEADIDSYIDSDEYNNAFGENIVPYCRGYRTAAGQTMLEFSNMLQLFRSVSSSDKNLTDNTPRVANAILQHQPRTFSQPRNAQDILAELFQFTTPVATMSPTSVSQLPDPQDTLIQKLQQQLAALRPVAGIGESVLRLRNQPKTVVVDNNPQRQLEDKAALIERLQGELMQARALAAIGEARLTKWRR